MFKKTNPILSTSITTTSKLPLQLFGLGYNVGQGEVEVVRRTGFYCNVLMSLRNIEEQHHFR